MKQLRVNLILRIIEWLRLKRISTPLLCADQAAQSQVQPVLNELLCSINKAGIFSALPGCAPVITLFAPQQI